MKRLVLISAIVIGGLYSKTANAQIGISLGLNIRAHHVYAPAANIAVETPVYAEDYPAAYNGGDDYYYLPEVGAYYNVAQQCYYYNDGNNWRSAAYLPDYPNYNWRNARRFEVRANRPYLNDDFYRSRYRGYAGNFDRHNNDNRAYNNRDFNRDEYRSQGQYDNRGDRNQGRAWGQQTDRQRSYPQSSYNNHEQGNNGQQFNNHQERGNNGNQQHYAENRGRDGHMRSYQN